VKNIALLFLLSSWLFGVSLAEIRKSYKEQHQTMEDLTKQIKKTRKAFEKSVASFKEEHKGQIKCEAEAYDLKASSLKASEMLSSLSDIEMQRAESSYLKNKQLIYRLLLKSYQMSSQEISEQFDAR